MHLLSYGLGFLAFGVLVFAAGLAGLYFLIRYFASLLAPKPAANDD